MRFMQDLYHTKVVVVVVVVLRVFRLLEIQ